MTTQNGYSAPRSPTLIETLASELGEAAGRLSKDVRKELSLALETMQRRHLELELKYGELERRALDAIAAIKNGERGEPGLPGSPGPAGPQGPAGSMPMAKEYAEGVHYAGAVVMHGGELYQATKDTGRAPPCDDWICLARKGNDGRGFELRGLYDDAATYRANDVVMLAGNSFAATRDNPGKCPGDGWKLYAKQGKAGPPGARGERGERGPPGIAAAKIIGWRTEGYAITPLLSDGGEGPALDLRAVFETYHHESGS